MKLPPLRLAGATFWPKKIHPSCQILTNLALCGVYYPYCTLDYQIIRTDILSIEKKFRNFSKKNKQKILGAKILAHKDPKKNGEGGRCFFYIE